MKTIYSFVAALLLLTTAAPFTSKANSIEKENAAISASQVSVKYTGSAEDSKVFHVAFDNPTAQKFRLIIKNDAGDIVYQGQFTDVHFAKTIHLLNEGNEINPTFIIRVGDQKVEHTFRENSNGEGYTEEVANN